MWDAHFWGPNASGYHATNLLIHTLNCVLLFFALESMTGVPWRAGLVAALFAWHPINVQTVAWISERKGLVCALFFLASLCAYVAFAKRPSRFQYILSFVLFCLGLMAKPAIVTGPLLLLLLDWWPLRRFELSRGFGKGTNPSVASTGYGHPGFLRLIWEKVPFAIVSLLFCALTIGAEDRGGALTAFTVPASTRIANALVSVPRYLWHLLWPAGLSVCYLHPASWPWWTVAGSSVFIGAAGVTAVFARNKRPYFAFGCLFFAVSMLPMIGIVQVGFHAMADRYVYISSIGIFIAIVWIASEWLPLQSDWPSAHLSSNFVPILLVVLAAGPLLARTRQQIGTWANSGTLFENAIRLDPHNFMAHANLGVELARQGRLDRAIRHMRIALTNAPQKATPHYNLARYLAARGEFREAKQHFFAAFHLAPDDLATRRDLAWLLATSKEPDVRDTAEAVRLAESLCEDLPGGRKPYGLLAEAYAGTGRFKEAVAVAELALSQAYLTRDDRVIASAQKHLDRYRTQQATP